MSSKKEQIPALETSGKNIFKKVKKIFKKGLTSGNPCDIIGKPRLRRHNLWKHSSVGRASALQAEGHRFEPYCFHHNGPVVQLVRTLACHARGRGFEPHPGRHFLIAYASVAQLVEQGTENPRVVGSIPIGGTTNFADLAHLVERDLAKVEVAGSSPVIRSRTKKRTA